MTKVKNGAKQIIMLLVLAICCILGFSACSSTDKYGKEETYYDLNSGSSVYFNTYTVYFDGKGNCNYCGVDCTYEIKNGNYYIYGQKTMNFKKVKDGVLVNTSIDINSFLNVSVRSGYISGSFFVNDNIINLSSDGTYQELNSYGSVVAIGNYYFNDGVLVLERIRGITNNGVWSEKIVYSAVYVNEGTGKVLSVLLKDPSYYKQWHFNNNNNDNDSDNDNYLRHALTYDLSYDGITIEAQPIAKGENINLIRPERAGYKFTGWYYNYEKIESGIWQYDGNITLTARWEAINYSITYNTDGGAMPDYYLQSFTVASYDLPYTLPVPTKQGYNFAGWYENADFSGEPITEIPKDSLRNYVLYAKYSDEQLLELELSFDETYYSVIGYKGSPQYIEVPKTKDGLPVKEIAAKAFENCSTLISIIIPDGVTNIGSYAFSGCSSLTSVTIPDGVTSIGNSAFDGCSRLTNIYYEGDIVSWCGIGGLRSLMSYRSSDRKLFIDGQEITGDLTIPDGVTNIGSYAFSGCNSLTSVTIPDSVTSIGYDAFSQCYKLTTVFYKGSAEGWDEIVIENSLGLSKGSIYYFSVVEPTDNDNYWHYDTDGKTPIIWQKEN